ncbi:MAG: NUDIX hydrolase [Leptolyngbya sp.]|nr:NUDIX hydrolase [Candidatus Melainabacteria bacterium]
MNRKLQLYVPALLSLALATMVHDRITALIGALLCVFIGATAGCIFFGGFSTIRRRPLHLISSTVLLFVIAFAIGVLLPGTVSALLAFPLLGLAGVFQFGLLGKKFALLVVGGPSSAPGYTSLLEVFAKKAFPVVHAKKLRALPLTVEDGAFVLVSGGGTADEIAAACKFLRARGYSPIVVQDAVNASDSMHHTLLELNEDLYQITVVGAVSSLLTAKQLKVYAFSKADCTTTTAVVLKRLRKVLVIKRDRAPYADQDSLPGGFLNVHLEGLPTCSAREVMEECFVNRNAKPGEPKFTLKVSDADVELVDVRSEPTRDVRGHVVDHGYVYFVPDEREEEVLANVSAGDDAKAGSARFEDLEQMLATPLAFDHGALLAGVKRLMGE